MCRMLRSTEIAPREATVAAGDSVTPVAEGVEAVWAATAPSQATTWLLVRATPEAEVVGHSAMRAGPKEAGPAIWAVMANRQGSFVEATAAEAVQRRTGSCLGQVIQAGEENSGERRVRFSAEAVARWAALFSTMAERSRFATVRLMGISRCVATAATMGTLGRRTMARTPAERFFRITARQLCST